MTCFWGSVKWMRCEEHGIPYPNGAECPKCAAHPIERFRKAEAAFEEAEEAMANHFTEWKDLIKEGKFEEAKESLRPMPQCATKVLNFRSIILAERQYNENR